MTTIRIIILSVLIVISVATSSFAGWLIYHKPEFRGKVIDAETKGPIEGAVVVVIYKKHSLISGPGGGYTSVVEVKETLTDKNGEFYFPPYTTTIQPNSIEDDAELIIYKPGYGSYPGLQISPPIPSNPETFFASEFGKPGTVRIDNKTFTYFTGIVELPKTMTKEERLRAKDAADISGAEISEKELPLLYKLIGEERKALGFK